MECQSIRIHDFEKPWEHISFICAAVLNSGVRSLIRMVRRSIESHLSCQICVCALLASAIFHFPDYLIEDFIHFPQPHVYHVFSCYCGPAFVFLVPCGCGWRSFSTLAHFQTRGGVSIGKRPRQNSDNSRGGWRGQPGGQADHGTAQSSPFRHDWESLEDAWE